ncbi:hypothetical protein WJU23_04560 [Prosthecobacter sp. SYSU 5D2]|uniref:hypothetical protein n=1 Tax=Prosthecobacter sp. SYSU 5D2 TaxID=3134134 RepID=UPI0031FE95E6
MKSLILLLAVLTTLLLPACNDTGKPLASGVVVTGKVWEKSLASDGHANSVKSIPVDSHVEVYERLLIIHQADGRRKVVPMEYVTDLVIK